MSEPTPTGTPPRANPRLVGHTAAEHAMLGAWRSGRMPHAWLIGGPRGIGKATLAYRFARFILAQGGANSPGIPADSLEIPASDPVFRRVAAGSHADLLSLEPGMLHPETNKPTQDIVVAHVRRAIDFLLKTAAEGGWRVVIVDEAEAMNRSAANALLKILEEPPSNCLLLLVSHNPGRLLPTIRSRCRLLTLQPLASSDADALLAELRPTLDAGERQTLVELANGSIGRALELADSGGGELFREIDALLGRLPELDVPAAHAFADRFARAGEGAEAGFRMVMELIADWIERRLTAGRIAGTLWFDARDRVRRLAGVADGLNLDLKHVLLGALFAVQRAAAAAARPR